MVPICGVDARSRVICDDDCGPPLPPSSGMAEPAAKPVPPVPATVPAPPAAQAPVSRRTQLAALALLLVMAGLIGWRWWADRSGTRPTEMGRDLTHRIDLNRASRAELMQ